MKLELEMKMEHFQSEINEDFPVCVLRLTSVVQKKIFFLSLGWRFL
jgi:hypothetical protein